MPETENSAIVENAAAPGRDRQCMSLGNELGSGRTICGNKAKAVHRFRETANRSNYLFWRNPGRKTVSHFSWNCSKAGLNPLRRDML
jgi:hypothetical protein